MWRSDGIYQNQLEKQTPVIEMKTENNEQVGERVHIFFIFFVY